jgi:hypothetical protein
MPAIREAYDDQDVTFYLQVYKDIEQAEQCLTSIRSHFPSSRIILMSDGDDDRNLHRLGLQAQCEVTIGERLYLNHKGGRMIQRMLDAFLKSPTHCLVKVDTDTRVHRRFRYLPEGRAVCGTLEWQTYGCKTKLDIPNVQGGCMLFLLDAAREMAESKILLSDELLDYRATYADNPDIVRRADVFGLISMDFVTRYACRQLQIPLVEFDEVYSIYRGAIPEDGSGYAITHPHKPE